MVVMALFGAGEEVVVVFGWIVVIHVDAVDWNCPSHIPRRFTREEAYHQLTALEAENAQLRAQLAKSGQ